MSVLDSLKKVLSPPFHPSELPEAGGWVRVESQLRIELPADYRDFIGSYGTGAIENFLWVEWHEV